jgi:acyl-CoA synthetase (AMP-forming)/AMP-acid ligase II
MNVISVIIARTMPREYFEDGWIHTGDVAVRDENGTIYQRGLKKMIIRNGFNVYRRKWPHPLQAFLQWSGRC